MFVCVCVRVHKACPCFHAAQETGSEEKAPVAAIPPFISPLFLIPLCRPSIFVALGSAHLYSHWVGVMETMGEKREMKEEEKDEGRESCGRRDKVTSG